MASDRMQPGKWWRVIDCDGKLWAETSDEEEARKLLLTANAPAALHRLYVDPNPAKEWREEDTTD